MTQPTANPAKPMPTEKAIRASVDTLVVRPVSDPVDLIGGEQDPADVKDQFLAARAGQQRDLPVGDRGAQSLICTDERSTCP